MGIELLSQPYVILLLITAAFFIIFMVVLMTSSTEIRTRQYAHIAGWVLLLIIGTVIFYLDSHQSRLLRLININHFFGGMVGASFFLFSLSYIHSKWNRAFRTGVIFFEFVLLCLYLFSPFIISDVHRNTTNVLATSWQFGALGFLFQLNYLGMFAAGFKNLLDTRKKTTDIREHAQLTWIIRASAIGAVLPTTVGLILPATGVFSYFWLTAPFGLVWFASTMYAVVRHHTFNLRLIAGEILILTLIFIAFINIFIGE